MQKLKYKPSKGQYRLYLTNVEAELLAFLLQHVRLGKGDEYKEAALDLCQAFRETDEFEFSELEHYMSLSVSDTESEGPGITVSELHQNENDHGDTCCGKCSGACSDQHISISTPGDIEFVTGSLLTSSDIIEEIRRRKRLLEETSRQQNL